MHADQKRILREITVTWVSCLKYVLWLLQEWNLSNCKYVYLNLDFTFLVWYIVSTFFLPICCQDEVGEDSGSQLDKVPV